MSTDVHVVIVTHNSARELPVCLDHLSQQSYLIASVIIVDSGSNNIQYLESIESKWPLSIIKSTNVGFSKANNLGFRSIADGAGSLVIFINPDTFLEPGFVECAVECFNKGLPLMCITGKLLSYDLERKEPTGRIDSSGIYRKWYGKWYDRGQGDIDRGQFDMLDEPPALCGALLCFRYNDLLTLGDNIFDPDFFLYKEDIELGLRLKKKGWRLWYQPLLRAYHCRGWQKTRQKVAYGLKIMSAKNEILLYIKHPSPYVCWSILKYLVVLVFRY